MTCHSRDHDMELPMCNYRIVEMSFRAARQGREEAVDSKAVSSKTAGMACADISWYSACLCVIVYVVS